MDFHFVAQMYRTYLSFAFAFHMIALLLSPHQLLSTIKSWLSGTHHHRQDLVDHQFQNLSGRIMGLPFMVADFYKGSCLCLLNFKCSCNSIHKREFMCTFIFIFIFLSPLFFNTWPCELGLIKPARIYTHPSSPSIDTSSNLTILLFGIELIF